MVALPPPPRIVSAELARLRAGGTPAEHSPVLGPPSRDDHGVPRRDVTFVWTPEPGRRIPDHVMVHLNGITDAHRDDLSPALMEPLAHGAGAAIAYRLPDDLAVSYRYVALDDLPRDIGRTRQGWLRAHQAGRPDSRNPESLPNPLGTTSSLLRLPAARRHPAEDPERTPLRALMTTRLAGPGMIAPGAVVAHAAHGPAPRALVLFDGEMWEALGVASLISRHAVAGLCVLTLGSGSLAERSDLLTDPERASTAVREALASARTAGLLARDVGPDAIAVAGQSYGGLAAASLLVHAPDLTRTAIIQSGSFQALDGALLDQVRGLSATGLGGRRAIVQYGSHEPRLSPVGAAFATASAAAGASVIHDPRTGGHDYAWWRTGLLDAVDTLMADSL